VYYGVVFEGKEEIPDNKNRLFRWFSETEEGNISDVVALPV
jgi:hypothetical protein